MLAISSDTVNSQEIRSELDVLLKSERFARSERQTSFLKYLCQAHIDGKTEDLNEYRIAVDVFNRRADHSPTEDSIVRVQVHELRRRLKEFYNGEGKDRPVRISIPKGGYAPDFTRVARGEGFAPTALMPPEIQAVEARKPVARQKIWIALGAASLALNCLLLVPRLITPSVSARASAQIERYAPYRELFGAVNGAPRDALICLSNPQVFLLDQRPKAAVGTSPGSLALTPQMKRVLGKSDPTASNWALFPTSDDYTGMGEAAASYAIGRLTERINVASKLSQARFLNWDRAREENLIVLGLPRATLWTRHNISSKFFITDGAGLRLKHPLLGQSRFDVTTDPVTGQIISDYALITKEMTPTGSWDMVLAGNSSVGTYGAGEFFCNPDKMELAFKKLRLLDHSNSLPQEFLVLIKVTVHENIPTAISLVDCQVSHL